MLQRALRQRSSLRLLLGAGDLHAGQQIHQAIAQRHDAGNATVDHTVAALVLAAEFLRQLVLEQAVALWSEKPIQ